jgi:hypothetical protein
MIEVIGRFEEAGQVMAAPASAEPEDLAFYVGRYAAPNPASRACGRAGARGVLGATLRLSLSRDAVSGRAPRAGTPRLVRTPLALGRAGWAPGAEPALPSSPRRAPMLSTIVVTLGIHQCRVSRP